MSDDFNFRRFSIIDESEDRINAVEDIIGALDFDSDSFTGVIGKLNFERTTILREFQFLRFHFDFFLISTRSTSL